MDKGTRGRDIAEQDSRIGVVASEEGFVAMRVMRVLADGIKVVQAVKAICERKS